MNTNQTLTVATLVAIYGNKNTICLDETERARALELARGSYQSGILLGYNCMSGSDLKGAARSYGGKYARSRDGLLARLRANDIRHAEIRGLHNKRILVIG